MNAFLAIDVRSKFFSLNLRDFIKGALYAVLSAVVIFVADLFKAGPVTLDLALLLVIGKTALATLIAYIAANFFQNSKGKFLTKDP